MARITIATSRTQEFLGVHHDAGTKFFDTQAPPPKIFWWGFLFRVVGVVFLPPLECGAKWYRFLPKKPRNGTSEKEELFLVHLGAILLLRGTMFIKRFLRGTKIVTSLERVALFSKQKKGKKGKKGKFTGGLRKTLPPEKGSTKNKTIRDSTWWPLIVLYWYSYICFSAIKSGDKIRQWESRGIYEKGLIDGVLKKKVPNLQYYAP